jgi:hypothetical protein
MSLSKSKCWYSNNYLHLLKHAVPLPATVALLVESPRDPRFEGSNPVTVGCGIKYRKDKEVNLNKIF